MAFLPVCAPLQRSGKGRITGLALLLPLLLVACASPDLDIRPPGSGVATAARPQPAPTVPAAAPVVEIKAEQAPPVETQQLAALPQPPAPVTVHPLSVPAYGYAPQFGTVGGKVKVAVLLPLGATDSGLRQDAADLRDAAQMALFERKDSGLSLMFLDTRGTREGAAQAARQAVAGGAQIMLGPLLRESVATVAPIARAASIPVLAFSNDEKLAGNGVYIMGQSPAAEVARIVDFGIKQGLQRFVSIAPRNAYGQLVTESMLKEVTRRGGSVASMIYYNPDTLDFSRIIQPLQPPEVLGAREGTAGTNRKIPRQKPSFDALLLPALSGQTLRTLTAQLAQMDIDQPQVRLLGLSPWNGFSNLNSEPPLIGAWYVAPAESATQESFAKSFTAYYQRQPGPLATLAYEGLEMVAQLAAGAGNGGAVATAGGTGTLQNSNVSLQFSPQGLVERPLAVRAIIRTGDKLMDPARLPPDAAAAQMMP